MECLIYIMSHPAEHLLLNPHIFRKPVTPVCLPITCKCVCVCRCRVCSESTERLFPRSESSSSLYSRQLGQYSIESEGKTCHSLTHSSRAAKVNRKLCKGRRTELSPWGIFPLHTEQTKTGPMACQWNFGLNGVDYFNP